MHALEPSPALDLENIPDLEIVQPAPCTPYPDLASTDPSGYIAPPTSANEYYQHIHVSTVLAVPGSSEHPDSPVHTNEDRQPTDLSTDPAVAAHASETNLNKLSFGNEYPEIPQPSAMRPCNSGRPSPTFLMDELGERTSSKRTPSPVMTPTTRSSSAFSIIIPVPPAYAYPPIIIPGVALVRNTTYVQPMIDTSNLNVTSKSSATSSAVSTPIPAAAQQDHHRFVHTYTSCLTIGNDYCILC